MRDRGRERRIKITVREGKTDGAGEKAGEWKYEQEKEAEVRFRYKWCSRQGTFQSRDSKFVVWPTHRVTLISNS